MGRKGKKKPKAAVPAAQQQKKPAVVAAEAKKVPAKVVNTQILPSREGVALEAMKVCMHVLLNLFPLSSSPVFCMFD